MCTPPLYLLAKGIINIHYLFIFVNYYFMLLYFCFLLQLLLYNPNWICSILQFYHDFVKIYKKYVIFNTFSVYKPLFTILYIWYFTTNATITETFYNICIFSKIVCNFDFVQCSVFLFYTFPYLLLPLFYCLLIC